MYRATFHALHDKRYIRQAAEYPLSVHLLLDGGGGSLGLLSRSILSSLLGGNLLFDFLTARIRSE